MRAQSVKSLLVVSLWRSIAFERCLICRKKTIVVGPEKRDAVMQPWESC
jgi:hypothetical protein